MRQTAQSRNDSTEAMKAPRQRRRSRPAREVLARTPSGGSILWQPDSRELLVLKSRNPRNVAESRPTAAPERGETPQSQFVGGTPKRVHHAKLSRRHFDVVAVSKSRRELIGRVTRDEFVPTKPTRYVGKSRRAAERLVETSEVAVEYGSQWKPRARASARGRDASKRAWKRKPRAGESIGLVRGDGVFNGTDGIAIDERTEWLRAPGPKASDVRDFNAKTRAAAVARAQRGISENTPQRVRRVIRNLERHGKAARPSDVALALLREDVLAGRYKRESYEWKRKRGVYSRAAKRIREQERMQ